MKRAWSSYHIKKYFKEFNPRNARSNYYKNEISMDNTTSFRIQNDELKSLNYKFFRHLNSPIKYKLKTKNAIKKKNNFQKFLGNNISDETTALLDTIKVQSGFNKFYNIAGTTKANDKANRMISAGTLVDMPTTKHTKRDTDKKSRVQSNINIKKKKRNFSSKFTFNRIGIGYNDNSNYANSIVNSYLMRINSKNYSFYRNNEKEIELSKTLTPVANKEIFYNININLGSMVNYNKQNNEEKEKEKEKNKEKDKDKDKENDKEKDNIKDICDKDLYKFLQDRKTIKSYENDNPEILKLRSDYLIKFAKINELYQKLNLITDCFRVNLRDLYSSSIRTLIKNFDSCNNFLLNELKVDENNQNFWTTILSYLHNFCFQTSKIQKFFYDELHFLKNENLALRQKLINQETELNTKTKELSQINKLIIKYDLNSKIKSGKKTDTYITNMKKKFTNQESHYVLTIHKLNQEIQSLTEALNKNKPDLQNTERLKDQLKELEKKYEDEVDKLSKLNGQKSTNIQVLTQRESNLYEQINDLENEISELKNKEKDEQDKNIILNAKIENLNKINEQNMKTIEELKNTIENYNQKDKKENENRNTAKIVLMAPI